MTNRTRDLSAKFSNQCYEQCKSFRPIIWSGFSDMRLSRKPKNARSKRALEAREPKEIEDPRTAIFVRGTHPGEKVNNVMKDLVNIAFRATSDDITHCRL